jgi:hypothetical protein
MGEKCDTKGKDAKCKDEISGETCKKETAWKT